MDLLTMVIFLIIIGVALYLMNKYVPMDAKIKTIINWVVVIVVVLWIVREMGLLDHLQRISVRQ